MYRLEEVTKAYGPGFGLRNRGTVAVRNVTLDIGQGVFGLVGPNGAGKTSLIRMMTTITRPTSGTIYFEGRPLWENPDRLRRRLGYLPQDFGFYPYWTVEEALGYGCWLKLIPAKRVSEEVSRTLELAGLQEHRRKWVRNLSGGMRKRLGIAFALLGDPDVIIVDEPTAGLDPEERIRFRLLLETLGLRGLTLISTHIIDDLTHANTLAIINEGRVLAVGPPGMYLEQVQGKVFEGQVCESTLSTLVNSARVVHLRRSGNDVFVRLVSAAPPSSEFSPATPSLEDAYLYYLTVSGSADGVSS